MLLYLHGVGDDGTSRDWWSVLRSVAGDPLDDVEVLAPDYSDLLSGEAPPGSGFRPAIAFPHPPLLARRSYRARQSALHADLMAAGAATVWPYRRRGFGRVPDLLDAIGERFVMDVVFDEVNRYTRDEPLRRSVRARVLEILPESGSLVVLGHSLGALVAIDLVRHLPDGLEVPLLVTAASALARRRLPGQVIDFPHTFPYDRVGGWINVFNPSDAVTRGRPIGMTFPQAVDVIAAGSLGDHSLATCVTEPGVSTALLDHLRHPRSLHHAKAAHSDEGPLPLPSTCELVTWLLLQHIQQQVATRPRARSDQLGRLEAARQLTVMRAAGRTGDPIFREGVDPAEMLHNRLAEQQLPAVLVRLASEQPLAELSVTAPKPLVAEARRRAAADIGIPPDWIEIGRHCVKEAGLLPPARRRRSIPAPDSPAAARLADEMVRCLQPMGLMRMFPATADLPLGDVAPAANELVARALVAGRLGQPEPGTEERAALHRALLLLDDARDREAVGGDPAVMGQLRTNAEVLAGSLAFLARRGLGIGRAN